MAEYTPQFDGRQPEDTAKRVKVIVDVLTGGTGKGREIPSRLVLGRDAYEVVKSECEETSRALREWRDLTTTVLNVEERSVRIKFSTPWNEDY